MAFLACTSRDFDIFMSKHLAGQWLLNSYFILFFTVVRSFTTSPAMINPATDGTYATLPGMSRRSVHLCAAPGGQMQFVLQLMDISSIGRFWQFF